MIFILEALSPHYFLEGQLISTAPIINFPQSAGAFRFYKHNINTDCLRSSYLFSFFLLHSEFSTPTRQYLTGLEQSATRESNLDACREMGSHYLSRGIRMRGFILMLSRPPVGGGAMGAQTGNGRGQGQCLRVPLSPSAPWTLVSCPPCLFKAPKEHVDSLPMEDTNTWGVVLFCVLSLFYQIRNCLFFQEPLTNKWERMETAPFGATQELPGLIFRALLCPDSRLFWPRYPKDTGFDVPGDTNSWGR